MESDREFAVSSTPSGSGGDSAWVGGPSLVSSLWRYRLVILVVTAVAAVAGLATWLVLPAKYEAQASLYLRDPGSPTVLTLGGSAQSQTSGDHAVFMATQAALVGSDAVYWQAQQILKDGGTPDDLRRSVVVEPSADLASITIRATSSDPTEAADLANAVGTAYEQVAAERNATASKEAIAGLQRVIDQRNVEFDSLSAQMADSPRSTQAALQRKALHVAELIGGLQVHQDNVAAQAALYGSGVESLQPPDRPVPSARPAPLLLALFGAVIGFVGASGWAWWAAGRNRRVEEEDDAGGVLAVPLLGQTPQQDAEVHGSGTDETSSSPQTVDPAAEEAYHVVLASLEHALARVGGKVVAVASAGSGDGKTVTVLNLALAAQREGRKVLLVDADERTRRLSQLCRDGEHFDVIGTGVAKDERPAFTAGGAVLQIGPNERNGHHPAVFFRSTSFASTISYWGGQADLIIVDTPALLDVSEAVTIADHVDAILMVVKRGTSLADLRRARERLAFTDTPLIGYVLNRRSAELAYVAYDRLRHWRPGRLPQLARSD